MKILSPCIITPRLMAGVHVGNGFISIDYSPFPGREGRQRYFYAVDVDGQSFEDSDLQSGVGGGELQAGLRSLLAFLCAAAESYEYHKRTGRQPEDEWTFLEWVLEWTYQHDDELSLIAWELEERPGIINELEG